MIPKCLKVHKVPYNVNGTRITLQFRHTDGWSDGCVITADIIEIHKYAIARYQKDKVAVRLINSNREVLETYDETNTNGRYLL